MRICANSICLFVELCLRNVLFILDLDYDNLLS